MPTVTICILCIASGIEQDTGQKCQKNYTKPVFNATDKGMGLIITVQCLVPETRRVRLSVQVLKRLHV